MPMTAPNPKLDPADDPSHGTHRDTWGRWHNLDADTKASRATARRGGNLSTKRPAHRKAAARHAARLKDFDESSKHGGMRRPGSMKRPH